jgi:hypothetical protein
MKRLPLLALTAAFLAAAGPAPLDHPGKIDWVKDPSFGFVKAKLEGRAAMLYFTADW